jgi:SAM-dependent methyltransferase
MPKNGVLNKPTKYNAPKVETPIKIDIGCGPNKRAGFFGIDIIKFDGVDKVMNAGQERWPFKDGSVDEVHASHFVEHLEPMERAHFVNELDRVLKPVEYDNAGRHSKGFATMVVPHWASQRAYGDLTHKWPPVSEFWFYYLDKVWREANAPHNDFYTCNLTVTWGYNMHPEIAARNPEYQQNAQKFWKEACWDIIATIFKK